MRREVRFYSDSCFEVVDVPENMEEMLPSIKEHKNELIFFAVLFILLLLMAFIGGKSP